MLPATHEPHPEMLAAASQARSKVVLAHIRAATDGDRSAANSHPFQFGPLLFMHNGGVPDWREHFASALRCPDLRRLLAGETDSEFAGALFAQHLAGGDVCLRSKEFEPAEVIGAMRRTVRDIEGTIARLTGASHGSLNFAASDGRTAVVTRFRTAANDEPPSLYFAITGSTERAAAARLLDSQAAVVGEQRAVSLALQSESSGGVRLWVASEPLDGEGACVLLHGRGGEACTRLLVVDFFNLSSEFSNLSSFAAPRRAPRAAMCACGRRSNVTETISGLCHSLTLLRRCIQVPLAKDQMLAFDTATATASLECLSKACSAELRHRSRAPRQRKGVPRGDQGRAHNMLVLPFLLMIVALCCIVRAWRDRGILACQHGVDQERTRTRRS